jgi:hypothetical protein
MTLRRIIFALALIGTAVFAVAGATAITQSVAVAGCSRC